MNDKEAWLIVDADSLMYAACLCSKEEDPEGFVRESGHAISRFDEAFQSIVNDLYEHHGVDVTHYLFVVGGINNFRKLLVPSYKANRLKREVPPMLNFISSYVQSTYGAYAAHGCEADDVVMATYKKLTAEGKYAIIASLDKDLKQQPCIFYDVYYQRRTLVTVNEDQARFNYYFQLLSGDTVDGVVGIKGIGIKTGMKLLAACTSDFSYRKAVYAQYKKKYGYKARERFIEAKLLISMNTRVATPTEFDFNIL